MIPVLCLQFLRMFGDGKDQRDLKCFFGKLLIRFWWWIMNELIDIWPIQRPVLFSRKLINHCYIFLWLQIHSPHMVWNILGKNNRAFFNYSDWNTRLEKHISRSFTGIGVSDSNIKFGITLNCIWQARNNKVFLISPLSQNPYFGVLRTKWKQ